MLPNIVVSYGFGLVGGIVGAMIYCNVINRDRIDSNTTPQIIDVDGYYIDDLEFQ